MGQVIGIDTDTVSTHQAGPKRQEIPFGTGGFQYFEGINAHFVEDNRQFIDQGDVEVALRIFDNLGGFGDLDTARFVRASGNDRAVEFIDLLGSFGRGAGGNLLDSRDPVFFIAWIDPLRAVTGEKICIKGQA